MTQHSSLASSATVHIFRSKRDTYGDVMWSMVYVDHMSGRRVYGRVDSRSSVLAAFPDAYHCDTELGIREYNRTTKDWGNAGCTCTELQTYVKRGLH